VEIDTLFPLSPPEQQSKCNRKVHTNITQEEQRREVRGEQQCYDEERDEQNENSRVEIELVLPLLTFLTARYNCLHKRNYDLDTHYETENVADSQDYQEVFLDD